jgi:regulator of protease activity HflC (stomatin/prohibitin superfamily)
MGFFVTKKERKRIDRFGDETTTVDTIVHRGRIVAAALVIIIALIFAISCFSFVPTGHTGVVTLFGKVEDYTLDSGVHFKNPFARVIKMDNRIQKESVELSCFSSDIQEVEVVFTLNYQISKEYAMNIYKTIGKNYFDTAVSPIITESVKTVAARYTAEDLINKRNELAMAIETDMKEKLLIFNIELVSTSIEDMDFTDAFTNAVEEKQVAAQNKLKAETEAAQRVAEAEAEAQIRRVTAEAEAYEILQRAEAEAQANQKLAESITDRLIEYRYYEVWDGKLPQMVMGESTTPMVQVP